MFNIYPTARLKPSPFFEAVVAEAAGFEEIAPSKVRHIGYLSLARHGKDLELPLQKIDLN